MYSPIDVTFHKKKSVFLMCLILSQHLWPTAVQWELKLGAVIITKTCKMNSGAGEESKQRSTAAGHEGV